MKQIKLPSEECKRNIVFITLLLVVIISGISLFSVYAFHNYIDTFHIAYALPLALVLGAALIALAINTKHTS